MRPDRLSAWVECSNFRWRMTSKRIAKTPSCGFRPLMGDFAGRGKDFAVWHALVCPLRIGAACGGTQHHRRNYEVWTIFRDRHSSGCPVDLRFFVVPRGEWLDPFAAALCGNFAGDSFVQRGARLHINLSAATFDLPRPLRTTPGRPFLPRELFFASFLLVCKTCPFGL
jgi:hypothetical protein